MQKEPKIGKIITTDEGNINQKKIEEMNKGGLIDEDTKNSIYETKGKINNNFTGTRKVVQLKINGELIIRFGSGRQNETHADIIMDALREFGITDYRKEKTSEGSRPELKGDKYEIIGAGLGTVINNKTITLGGKSLGYNMEISDESAHQIGKEMGINFFVSHLDGLSDSKDSNKK